MIYICLSRRYLVTTHFEATHARAAFPCFDEPAMKANFTVIMVREPQHTALSNMPVEKTVRLYVHINFHCVKSVQIRSFFKSVFFCIRTEYGIIRTRKKSVFGHFSQCLLQKAELAIKNFFIKFEQIRRKQYEKFQGKFLRNRESWLMISSITIYSSARSSGHHQSV